MRPRSALVVGAGIAGLSCAYYLRKREIEVVVVESNRVGSGASHANLGWICPAQAGPLPEPGLVHYGVRALFDPRSALYFKPSLAPALAPWLLRFWSHCNERDRVRGVEAFARLGRDSFALIEEMAADGVDFELHRVGMLVAARSAPAARAELRKLAPMRALGYELPDEIIAGAELHALEPALADAIQAGFLVRQHWHVRPDSLTAGLAAWLRRAGVEILEGAEVVDFELAGRRVGRVRTAAGDRGADAVVLAAGAWTRPLARMLGVGVPLQAGKGYSFLVTPGVVPRHALLLADVHVACSPLGERLRIGGTMEFSGLNSRLDQRRIEAIVRGARDALAPWSDATAYWTGMRPIMPDGLPLVDRMPGYDNLYLATGYSMQGMTVAAPAGRALAELVVTGLRPASLTGLGLDRLRRLPWRAGADAGGSVADGGRRKL